MASLCGAVPEKQMLCNSRRDPFRARRGRRSDESVDHHRDILSGASEAHPSHRGDLETTDGGENPEAIGESIAMALQRAFDHINLTFKPRVIDAVSMSRQPHRHNSSRC